MYKKIYLSLFIATLVFGSVYGAQTEQRRLFFTANNYRLNSDMTTQLHAVIEKSKAREITRIKIKGYSNDDGHSIYNHLLFKKRLAEVYRYFVLHGMSQELLSMEQEAIADSTQLEPSLFENESPFFLVEITVEYKYSVPDGFDVEIIEMSVNAEEYSNLPLDTKGTTLHVPANAFVDDLGNPVKGNVTIQFKEYTNPAEIAFSGIPMTYTAGYTEYNFNSSGMFEISGVSNGKNVHVAKNKSLQIDYALAKQNPDISFFKLKEDGSGWDKIQEIAPKPMNLQENVQNLDPGINDARNLKYFNPNLRNINRANNVPNNAWINDDDVKLNVPRDRAFRNKKALPPMVDNGDRTQSTLLGDGTSSDAGHTYPDVVKGLNVQEFGVYNCDQIYRLANRVQVTPKFVDESGNALTDLHVLSLIDLKYNGAFSFNPSSFSCDAKAKNVLALFTHTGELYMMGHEEFEKIKIEGDGSYTFKMKNMSSKIKTHKDLAKYLGIEI